MKKQIQFLSLILISLTAMGLTGCTSFNVNRDPLVNRAAKDLNCLPELVTLQIGVDQSNQADQSNPESNDRVSATGCGRSTAYVPMNWRQFQVVWVEENTLRYPDSENPTVLPSVKIGSSKSQFKPSK